jgi:signal peptidase I
MSDLNPYTPGTTPPRSPWWKNWKIVVLVLFVGAIGALFGMERLRIYTVPTNSMAPTIKDGETVTMEGVTFFMRSPRRGDIIVFRTGGLEGFSTDQRFVKRVIGEPGEQLKISDGKLYINGHVTPITNASGEIVITCPPGPGSKYLELTIPPNSYFAIGDNTASSYDSRGFGCIPRGNILGRVCFRK